MIASIVEGRSLPEGSLAAKRNPARGDVAVGDDAISNSRPCEWGSWLPLKPSADDADRAPIRCLVYCKRLAQRLATTDPDRYTIVSSPARRENTIFFIDYLRNGRGNTTIGTYLPRARPGFPIAAPVSWAQVERRIRLEAGPVAEQAARHGELAMCRDHWQRITQH
jgi:DNA primase